MQSHYRKKQILSIRCKGKAYFNKKFEAMFRDFKECINATINYSRSKITLYINRLYDLKKLLMNQVKDDRILVRNDSIIKLNFSDKIQESNFKKDIFNNTNYTNQDQKSSTLSSFGVKFESNSRNLHSRNEKLLFNDSIYSNFDKMFENKKNEKKISNDINKSLMYKTDKNFIIPKNIEQIKLEKHKTEFDKDILNSTLTRNNSTNFFFNFEDKKTLNFPKISFVDPLGYDKLMKNKYPDIEYILSSHKEQMKLLYPESREPEVNNHDQKKGISNFNVSEIYYSSFYQAINIESCNKFKHNYKLKKLKKI